MRSGAPRKLDSMKVVAARHDGTSSRFNTSETFKKISESLERKKPPGILNQPFPSILTSKNATRFTIRQVISSSV